MNDQIRVLMSHLILGMKQQQLPLYSPNKDFDIALLHNTKTILFIKIILLLHDQ